MPDSYIFKDEAFWPVDADGNIIQTREVPAGADTVQTIITPIPTGDSIPDPASKYTYYMAHPGYKTKDLDKFKRVNKDDKETQQRAIAYILSHPEIYGELTEEDLKNEDIVQELYNKQYTKSADAKRLNWAFYPQLSYTIPGHLGWRDSYITDWNEYHTVCGGRACRDKAIKIKVPEWVKKDTIETKSHPLTVHTGHSSYLPVMQNDTTYVWSVPPEYETESKAVQNVTTSDGTTGSSSSGNATGTRRTSGSPSTQTSTNSQRSASTSNSNETIKWRINPFTGERTKLKFGGKMNYFSYFN